MNEKLKIDSEFEKKKEKVEYDNRRENHQYLASKFSEKLAESPIVFYYQDINSFAKIDKVFDKVTEVRTDESGTGGSVDINFTYNDWISVNKTNFRTSDSFERYKISEESFQNILTMMSEAIKISGYSEAEKNKMFQDVVNYFKSRIINKEDLEKIKE